MAFYTDLANVHKNRPIKPIYGWTQATPQSWELAAGEECFPGMLMVNVGGGKVRGAKAGEKPFGICSTFQNELTISGSKQVAVWVPNADAVLEIDLSVTDPAAKSKWATAKTNIAAGEAQYVGLGANSKLTVVEETTSGETITSSPDALFRIVDIIGTTHVQIAGL